MLPMEVVLTSKPETLSSRLAFFARDIKLSHTIFAMPFALLSTFLAAHQRWHGLPRWGQLALILICMVAARTVAIHCENVAVAVCERAAVRPVGRRP